MKWKLAGLVMAIENDREIRLNSEVVAQEVAYS